MLGFAPLLCRLGRGKETKLAPDRTEKTKLVPDKCWVLRRSTQPTKNYQKLSIWDGKRNRAKLEGLAAVQRDRYCSRLLNQRVRSLLLQITKSKGAIASGAFSIAMP